VLVIKMNILNYCNNIQNCNCHLDEENDSVVGSKK